MSDEQDKGFLSRWSQRKAEARRQEVVEPEPDSAAPKTEAEEPVDPQSLPPVDELTESSDFTPYLRKGVPEAMRKAALRKLWVTEPSVVNYVPLVEYAWHQNEPGFGPLLPTDDVEKLLKQIVEGNPFSLPPEPEQNQQPAEKPATETLALAGPEDQPVAQDAGPQEEPVPLQPPRPRRHGGALPS